MQVDQRQVTNIYLQDGRERDFTVLQEGNGYRLSLVSKGDVVNLLLSSRDLNKLRQAIVKAELGRGSQTTELRVGRSEYLPSHGEMVSTLVVSETIPYSWSKIDWLSFN